MTIKTCIALVGLAIATTVPASAQVYVYTGGGWFDFGDDTFNAEISAAVEDLNEGLAIFFQMLTTLRDNSEELKILQNDADVKLKSAERKFEAAALATFAQRTLSPGDLSPALRLRFFRLMVEMGRVGFAEIDTGSDYIKSIAMIISRLRENIAFLGIEPGVVDVDTFTQIIGNKMLIELMGSNCDVVGAAMQ